MGLKTIGIDTVNTTTVVVLFCIFVYDILIQLSEKAGQESQYSLMPPSSAKLWVGGVTHYIIQMASF